MVNGFFKHLIQRALIVLLGKRQLKTDILIEVVAIIFISIAVIISYSYYSNTRSILEQSQDYMKSYSVNLKQRIVNVLKQTESIIQIYVPFLRSTDLTQFSTNMDGIQSMSSVLTNYPYLTSVYFGTPEGLFLELVSSQRVLQHLVSTGRKIPDNITGVIKIVDHPPGTEGNDVNEIWHYVQNNRTILPKIIGEETGYDHRKRDWYINASKEQKLGWSHIYVFASTLRGEAGITASMSIFDQSGGFKGVFAADITLKSFSQFLADAKVTPNTLVYVLDEKNRIVATSEDKNNVVVKDLDFQLADVSTFGNPLLQESTTLYETNKGKENVIVFRHDGREYISVYEDFPKIFLNNWRAVIIAPTDDFVADIKHSRDIVFMFSAIIFLLSIFLAFRLARRISTPITYLSTEANKIRDLDLEGRITISSRIREIEELSTAMNTLKTTMQSFSYYIPRALVKKLLQQKQTVHVGGKSKEVSILFTDIAGFTTISETLSADRLVKYLSEYFEEMTKIIMDKSGTVDKYIGDAIMAFWGAPLQDRHHAFHACNAALVCQKRLVELNRQWKLDQRPVFFTRMGVHSGNVIVGNIGSSERMNYTAIGDNVNLATRLESLNKFYGSQILVTEDIYIHVKDQFLFRPLDYIAVKGKANAVRIYELLAQLKGDITLLPTDEQIAFCKGFDMAYKLYLTRQFKEALEAFEDIQHTLGNGDLSIQLYITRCQEFIKTPPPKDWAGISHMSEK